VSENGLLAPLSYGKFDRKNEKKRRKEGIPVPSFQTNPFGVSRVFWGLGRDKQI
jgi:hypothetical protein